MWNRFLLTICFFTCSILILEAQAISISYYISSAELDHIPNYSRRHIFDLSIKTHIFTYRRFEQKEINEQVRDKLEARWGARTLEEYLDSIIEQLNTWNDFLNIFYSLGGDRLFRVYNEDNQESFFFVLYYPNSCYIIPLDSNYKLNMYDWVVQEFEGNTVRSFENFLLTLEDNCYIQEINIEDADGDEMLDAVLYSDSPIYTNTIDPNSLAQINEGQLSPNLQNLSPSQIFYSSGSDDNSVPDNERELSLDLLHVDTNYLNARYNGFSGDEMIDIVNRFISLFSEWNTILDFICNQGISNCWVFQVFVESRSDFTTALLTNINDTITFYPLDQYSSRHFDFAFNNRSPASNFVNDESGALEFLIEILATNAYAQLIQIGDFDSDHRVDAFLAEGDPIYQNIDGNLKIVGYCGEFEE